MSVQQVEANFQTRGCTVIYPETVAINFLSSLGKVPEGEFENYYTTQNTKMLTHFSVHDMSQ